MSARLFRGGPRDTSALIEAQRRSERRTFRVLLLVYAIVVLLVLVACDSRMPAPETQRDYNQFWNYCTPYDRNQVRAGGLTCLA